ncbi:MAG: right-handed parallel beta-helix repeat-containing protein [Planctomycetia bacterium]|nr:right-handed parallel beta-helix repeat-containing protein [Planctomycetia bacterium]
MKPRRTTLLNLEVLEARDMPAVYYVAPTGNNGNNGSSSTPWLTLQHAANVVQAGDTVIVRAGDYVGFHLTRDGTASQRITFSAEPGVRVVTRNATTPDGINLEGADYITIEGFTVINQPRTGIRSVLNNHVIIRNNVAHNNNTWGILTGYSDDLLIENNQTSGSLVEHGIYVSNSSVRPTIRNNLIFNNNANGIHLNGDAVIGGGNGLIMDALIENNVIYNNGVGGGSGINGDGLVNSVIRNNLIYNTHASGISLYRIDGGAPSTNNLVVNNTVLVASDGRWAMNISNGSTGNTLRNNIFYSAHSFRGSITISADSLLGFTSDYNVTMNRFSINGGSTVITQSAWQSNTGQDTHSFLSTPGALFLNVGINDYRLSLTSVAKDSGILSFAPPSDIVGASRPSGAGVDIGAFEGYSKRKLKQPANLGGGGSAMMLSSGDNQTSRNRLEFASTLNRQLQQARQLQAKQGTLGKWSSAEIMTALMKLKDDRRTSQQSVDALFASVSES